MKKLKASLLIIFYLAVIDVSVNFAFHYPTDPKNTNPSFLQRYFEYGRSVEGKLKLMTRHSIEESAPKVSGGWISSDKGASLPSKTIDKQQVLIALYGMSHTKCLWEAIQKHDKTFLIRGFMAPGAAPNWSYGAYEFDRGKHNADVVILGIMTEGVSQVTSTTGMTTYFDSAYPYTFPRYSVKGGKLISSYPPFISAEDYIDYFFDKSKWSHYRDWLSSHDKFYDPLLFRKSMLDNSVTIRLLRRAYSESKKEKISLRITNNYRFNEKSEEVKIVRSIIKNFAESVRADGSLPIIYIVNLQGQGDKLYRMLKPVLELNNIPYLSTHKICPPDDPRVFLSENSHFIPSKDMELAGEIIHIIKTNTE